MILSAVTLLKVLAGLIIGGSIFLLGSVFYLSEFSSDVVLPPIFLVGIGTIWLFFRSRRNEQRQNVFQSEDVDAQSDPTAISVHENDILNGVGVTVLIKSNGLTIKSIGTASFFVHGLKGEKFLPFKSIMAVQIKKPGKHMSGYIQFSVAGGLESTQGIWDASKDENTVLFTRDHMSIFLGLRELVEERISRSDSSTAAAIRGSSSVQDLIALASLRENGHLTDEEFAIQKLALLRR